MKQSKAKMDVVGGRAGGMLRVAVTAAMSGMLCAPMGASAGALALVGPGATSSPTEFQVGPIDLSPGQNANRAPEAISKTTGKVIPNGAVLLSWTGDAITDDGVANSDFVAVIDAEPDSTTYGKVIWTAGLPKVIGANNPGAAYGHTADVHNDPHHNTAYTSYIDPVSGRKYMFVGGVISGNVFRYDITDVRAIKPAEMAICGTELTLSALTDDFMVLPNGNMAVTYMGGKSYGGPGTVTEFHPMRTSVCTGGTPYNALLPASLQDPKQFLSENSAVVLNSGIQRYKPNKVTGNTDAGLEAYPHGMQLTADGTYLVTSDYAMPASIGAGDPIANLFNSTFLNSPLPGDATSIRMFGTTVRVWKASDLKAGPITISQVPDGPRVEDIYFHEEPEGQMAFGMPHLTGHTDPVTGQTVPHQGAFTASMCGGTLYYTSDILAPQSANNGLGPRWNAVYDVGPCTGVSYFGISDDDKTMYLPISGIQSPGDPEYNRDYPGEHDRRMLALDIRPLINKGTGTIQCDFPASDPSRPGNTSLGKSTVGNALNNRVHNNGAPDCPKVIGMVTNNSAMNYASHGGAHFTLIDRAGAPGSSLAPGKRLMFMDYFVNLDHMGLQGTGSDGDRKIYMVKINGDGSLAYDTNFRDELTGEVGLAFSSPQRAAYNWPNRGVSGAAKPHAGIFEYNGLKLTGPESYNQ